MLSTWTATEHLHVLITASPYPAYAVPGVGCHNNRTAFPRQSPGAGATKGRAFPNGLDALSPCGKVGMHCTVVPPAAFLRRGDSSHFVLYVKE